MREREDQPQHEEDDGCHTADDEHFRKGVFQQSGRHG